MVLPAFFRWNGRGRRPEAIAEENGGGTPLEDPETVNPNMKPLKTTFSTLCIRLWVDHSPCRQRNRHPVEDHNF